jgi:hypothetical protein
LVAFAVLVALGLTGGACAPARIAPHMIPSQAVLMEPDERAAVIVFARPASSCEAARYFTVAAAAAGFLGNLPSGTWFAARVPPGEHLLVAWNPERERFVAAGSENDVAVMRAAVRAGATYYVRLAFGEWPEGYKLPRPNRWTIRPCRNRDPVLTAVRPGADGWSAFGDGTGGLTFLRADRDAGQEALDRDPDGFGARIALAKRRYAALPAEERRACTLSPGDGAVRW